MTDTKNMTTHTSSPVILSAMQPTSGLTLGNYVGALQHWVKFQTTHTCYYCVVDLHALTVRPNPQELHTSTLDVAAMYIAAGVDPERHTVFIQSHVSAHAELAWVLGTYTGMGECMKMTQFKEKSEKHSETIGLFTYPVLMAADILLYDAHLVPVGDDQRQHLELARNLAERFNHYYPDTFTIPEPYFAPVGARIMSLQDPEKKMSKSDSHQKATIFLSDSPDEIRNKIKRAVTDSGTDIRFDKQRPAVHNLLTLYQVATGQTTEYIEQHFAGKGFGALKNDLADALVELLRPVHERYTAVRHDTEYLNGVIRIGAERANAQAQTVIHRVYSALGLVHKPRS